MSSQPLALVIENDAGTRRLLHVLLSRLGIEADMVANGRDALLLLDQIEYDLLVLNLMLPGASGVEILNRLATARPTAIARSVVLSSAPEAQLQRVRQRWPQLRTMRKPFELGDLLDAASSIVTTRVERTLTPADEFCRRSVQVGAKTGVIMRVRGTTIEPMLTYGYTPDQVAPFLSMKVEDPFPLCRTIRDRTPIWCVSVGEADAEFPLLASVFAGNRTRAFATVPVTHGTNLVGAAGWTYSEPRHFGDAEQQMLTAIAARVWEMLATSSGAERVSTPA